MNNWRKYNGALIPSTPPHIEVNIKDNLFGDTPLKCASRKQCTEIMELLKAKGGTL